MLWICWLVNKLYKMYGTYNKIKKKFFFFKIYKSTCKINLHEFRRDYWMKWFGKSNNWCPL